MKLRRPNSAILPLIVLLLPACAFADTTAAGDLWIDGKLGINTASPGARTEVAASSMAETIFQVSGVDETPFIQVGNTGLVGLSTTPTANLDISGVGDAGDIGLELRAGNASTGSSSMQMVFGYAGQAAYRHAVRTGHAEAVAGNTLDFLLWNSSAGASSSLPVMEVMSLQTSTTSGAGAGLHIRPVGTAGAELVVSNGTTYAGGTIHRLSAGQPSSLEFKSDVRYLGEDAYGHAYAVEQGLGHAAFRYKNPRTGEGTGALRRGLIFEEAPQEFRRSGKTLSVDERALVAEMGLVELMRRLERLEREAGHE